MQKGVRRVLAIVGVVVSTAGYGLFRYRDQRIDRLYAQATGVPPGVRSAADPQAAAKELGTYKGSKSEQMLVNIALGRTVFAQPGVQREAMSALASRHDPSISSALAMVLQPHYALPTRQAAAETLQTTACSTECFRTILHYLERVWQGEPNYEDRTRFPAGLDEGVKADLAKDQQALYETLCSVLKREGQSTLRVLAQVYGLGTSTPSKFSLAVVKRMQFHGACPQVLQSERLAKQTSADSFLAPREELEATLQSLRCQ
jgi:hypothetical protein